MANIMKKKNCQNWDLQFNKMILFFNDSVGSKKSRYLEDFMEQDIVKIANSAVFSQIQGRSLKLKSLTSYFQSK